MIPDLLRISDASPNLVDYLKSLRQYWINNYKTLDEDKKELITKLICEVRKNADTVYHSNKHKPECFPLVRIGESIF